MTPLEKLLAARRRWETEYETKGKIPSGTRFVTTSSMEVPPLSWTEDPSQAETYMEKLGFPGQYPFTRGVHSSMYRGKWWTMRQFSGFATPEETNKRYRYILEQGGDGLSVAFDLPTLMGRDPDSEWSLGEVGKCGVSVASLEDAEILFKDIPLGKITTSMTINSPAAIIWAFYIAAAENQGWKRSDLGGTLQNDILKEYIAQKEFIYPPKPSLKLVVDTIEFATKEMPRFNPVSISGYHIREAGSTAIQELAFTLADGFAYVEAAIERGLDVDEFAPRLSHFFNSHLDFFEEIGKFRAARRIWAKRMKEKYGAKNERSLLCRFHTQTAGCSLQAQQPEVNLIRTATEALAAVLGGTQSLHTNSMDETLALPSEKAVTLAMRTQQVLKHEVVAGAPIDPLGGSYFVEWMTDKMEAGANDYFDRIEAMGGVVPAIENGFFQRELARAAQVYQSEFDRGERVLVGVNRYVQKDEEIEIPLLDIAEEDCRRQQVDKLSALKRRRDGRAAQECLDNIKLAAEKDENLMPHLIAGAHAYCTLGEMVDVLKEVYSEYEEPVTF
ncbi:MAG: methylmalonyl-CoA mutase [Calditrichaeota bacterium]|nr:methylmalonyl-CoA mutase [Calditrichota bacterium]MCB9368092.1 methylmalonyl-CoA mutase [Calditrichota bacterium]